MSFLHSSTVAYWRYPLAFIAAYLAYVFTQPLFGPLFKWAFGHGWLIAIFIWAAVCMVTFALLAVQSSLPMLVAPNILGAVLVLGGSLVGRWVRLTAIIESGGPAITKVLITEALSVTFLIFTVGSFVMKELKARKQGTGR